VGQVITRRGLLALLPAGIAAGDVRSQKSNTLPRAVGEFVRFLDPTTETPVVRLTNPAWSSALPAPANRFIATKDRSLFFSSDRGGRMCPFRTDLHTGLAHQVAETSSLETESLCLDESGRFLYFIDERTLKEANVANRKVRSLAEDVDAFGVLGHDQFVVVRKGRLQLANRGAPVIAEEVANFCLAQPGGEGCLFVRETSQDEREFWYVALSGAAADRKPKLLAKGPVTDPFWSPDRGSVLFLREVPRGESKTSEIHQTFLDGGEERRVADTSQFAAFAPNGDATVFVGASRSKAQPTILLLLRSVHRELTLCEHRSKHPALVSPVFSPDSRRVYFQSDREGKPALYSVNVEALVEPTNSAV
jgi:oligogalacturonide lyase